MQPTATHCGVGCLHVCAYATGMNPAETAEPIKMQFGMWARMGSSNHVLDGSPDPQRKGQFWGWAHISLPAVGIFNKMMQPFIKLLQSLVVACNNKQTDMAAAST